MYECILARIYVFVYVNWLYECVCINQWMYECMNKLLNECVCMNVCVHMDECLYMHMNKCLYMKQCTYKCVCKYEPMYMYGWMDVCNVYEWMNPFMCVVYESMNM